MILCVCQQNVAYRKIKKGVFQFEKKYELGAYTKENQRKSKSDRKRRCPKTGVRLFLSRTAEVTAV